MIYASEISHPGFRVTVEVEVDEEVNDWILESTLPMAITVAETTRELHNEVALAIRGEWSE